MRGGIFNYSLINLGNLIWREPIYWGISFGQFYIYHTRPLKLEYTSYNGYIGLEIN